jgi:hypothetical protein
MHRATAAVVALAAAVAAVACLAHAVGGSPNGEARSAMLVLFPDAAKAAESFSKFLKKTTESGEWTAEIRQVYHITLPDAASAALKDRHTNSSSSCSAAGKVCSSSALVAGAAGLLRVATG